MKTLLQMLNLNEIIVFSIGLTLGIYFITLNVLGVSLTHFPGDLGDGRLNVYFLEHAYKLFSGELASYWDAPFMYPEKNVLAYSDNLLGSAPIYGLFRWLGYDTFSSYQLWFISLSVLNYAACYLLLKYLFNNSYAAVIGALVFAFSMALQSQMTHVQMFPRFPIPLAFLFLLKFEKQLAAKYLFWALLMVVYQIYCGIYLGFMLVVPFGIMLVIIYLRNQSLAHSKIRKLKWSLQIVGSLVINALILLPLMLPYMERSKSPSINHYRDEIVDKIPTIKSHFFSQKGSVLWDFMSNMHVGSNAWWDHQIFAGALATLCLIVFIGIMLWKWKTKRLQQNEKMLFSLALTALVTFFFYLRINAYSSYILLYFLPGFTSMRAISRIINIELLFFAIATAWVMAVIIKQNSWKYFSIFILACSVFLLDNYFKEGKSYRTEKKIAYERTEKLIELMRSIPQNAIVSFEPEEKKEKSIYYQIDAMLASQANNLTCINAYTGNTPGYYTPFWYNLNDSTRNHWLSHYTNYSDTLYVIKSVDEIEKIILAEEK